MHTVGNVKRTLMIEFQLLLLPENAAAMSIDESTSEGCGIGEVRDGV